MFPVEEVGFAAERAFVRLAGIALDRRVEGGQCSYARAAGKHRLPNVS